MLENPLHIQRTEFKANTAVTAFVVEFLLGLAALAIIIWATGGQASWRALATGGAVYAFVWIIIFFRKADTNKPLWFENFRFMIVNLVLFGVLLLLGARPR